MSVWEDLSNVTLQQQGCPACPAMSCPMQHCKCRYETVTAEAEALERPYNELGRMLNCSPNNIAILQSATAAWAQVCTSRAQSADCLSMSAHPEIQEAQIHMQLLWPVNDALLAGLLRDTFPKGRSHPYQHS